LRHRNAIRHENAGAKNAAKIGDVSHGRHYVLIRLASNLKENDLSDARDAGCIKRVCKSRMAGSERARAGDSRNLAFESDDALHLRLTSAGQ
jgi:hypothetical protein